MKILHVLSSTHLGGAEIMCLQLAREQLASGKEVAVHFFENGAAAARSREWNIPTYVCQTQIESSRKKNLWHADEKGLSNSIEKFQPDIVHSHVPKTNLICSRVLKNSTVPWVATAHGSWKQFGYAPDVLGKPFKKYLKWIRHAVGDFLTLRSSSGVASISDYVKNELAQIGIPKSKVTVIHNGLPYSANPWPKDIARDHFKIPRDSFVLGSLGHFSPVKGFDILIDAFSKFADSKQNTVLVIAGGDVLGNRSVRNSLESQINKKGLKNRVFLLNQQDDLSPFFSCLDLFIVSSRSEGFSLALVEAMQYGLPSIVTSAGGSLEAARPDQESLVFSSGNPASLAVACLRLIDNPSLGSQFAQSALARSKSHLSLSRCISQYDLFYSSLLPKSAGSLQK